MTFNNVVIFGDSYSTFEGYIPEGYLSYYLAKDTDYTDVKDVTETWWHLLISETNSNLVLNDSWSGSTICHTGYNNKDCSQTSSFIYRFRKLLNEGFFEKNKIDTIFVFGATNDSYCDAPLGELKLSDWQESDLFNVLSGIPYFLKTLKDTLPDTKIYCIVNTEMKQIVTDGILKACKEYSIPAITFDFIDKTEGHPTVEGMKQIKDRILKVIDENQ